MPGQPSADKFVSNLSNYLALGCSSSRHQSAHASYRSDDAHTWQEGFCAEDVIDNSSPCFFSFGSLLRARWIRAFYKVEDEVAIIRIYILPEDVGRRYIDRSDRGLRQALKNIIPTLDISSGAWEGTSKSSPTRLTDGAEEETSLFYLFNKLQSPLPDATKVQDKYARRAMETLLDTERTVKGLKTHLYPYQRRAAATMLQREVSPGLELDPRLQEYMAPEGSTFYYDKEDCLIFRTSRCYESARGGILAGK